MPDYALTLTPLHYLYLLGVLVILVFMIFRKTALFPCIFFIFLLGFAGLHSLAGGITTVFSAILYAAREFMEVIAAIALIIALSQCLKDLGSDRLMMIPMSKIIKSPVAAWWLLGAVMLLFSLFLWPSPAVALVGVVVLPFALKAGLDPLMAAMSMNLFGHGLALSWDFVIQGAPAICAGAAGISASDILTKGRPLFLVMGLVTAASAYWLNRKEINVCCHRIHIQNAENAPNHTKAGLAMAFLTPLFFLADFLLMLAFEIKGRDAAGLVAGTAVLAMCLGAALEPGVQSLEKVSAYITEGFLFAIRIFAPVIVIGAFFFLGGEGISSIMGEQFQGGIVNDWALWLSGHAALNKFTAAFLQLGVGCLTGLDGSGFSGLPLVGSLARTFGEATGAAVPILVSLGQIGAIYVGGGTIVPWSLIPVAAICCVNPLELARKNFLPVLIGFGVTLVTACFLL